MENLDWTTFATALDGGGFAVFQGGLARYNSSRLDPALPTEDWRGRHKAACAVTLAEGEFIEAARRETAVLCADIPTETEAFIVWFERLGAIGPGQGDGLFPWLANVAGLAQMKWFLSQEVAGEAGFEDLLAVTQVKIPEQAKLEMARNYWDEMGRGASKGMHGPMLARLAEHFDVDLSSVSIVPEALALSNMMVGLALNRRYAFHSVGALGVIEMTAPARASLVNQGLKRLGIAARHRHYFALHSVLDVKHSEAWNAEVLRPLVSGNPACAQAIGEGAILRLWCGARCFEHYRRHFDLPAPPTSVAA